MNLLAFDTCLDKMYITLANDNEILASKIVETTKEHYHSAFLISTIKNILIENHLTPQDIEVIATNIGPGSFTGIRACTTAARVFAQAVNAKTVGVSSLEILSRLNDALHPNPPLQGGHEYLSTALTCFAAPPGSHASYLSGSLCHSSQLTIVALDARREMAYFAIFDGKKQVSGPKAILLEN
jgi:universal bacterial protein YeaZ